MATEVIVRQGVMASYATALRGHLSAAMAYVNTSDFEDAEEQLHCASLCLDVLNDCVYQKKKETP